jgi:hypothetical protein
MNSTIKCEVQEVTKNFRMQNAKTLKKKGALGFYSPNDSKASGKARVLDHVSSVGFESTSSMKLGEFFSLHLEQITWVNSGGFCSASLPP